MTIWLHFTGSYFWSRPPAGIIRVERELFAALAGKTDEPMRYCVFVGGEFYEVDPAGALSWAGQQAETGKATAFARLRGAVWAGGKAVFYHFLWEGGRAEPVLRQILAWRNKFRRSQEPRISSPVADIRPGDRFLTVSNDGYLDYPVMFHRIVEERQAAIIGFFHDVLPVDFPEFFVRGTKARMVDYFRALTSASSLLLCNSVCTRNDALKFIENQGLTAPPLVVVPLGCNLPASGDLTCQETARLPKSTYILFVSTIERRKNHRMLYEVYAEMAGHADFERLPTICMVGMPGWRVNDLLDDIELNDRIAHKFLLLDNVSDAMLARLYHDALFCVYPSYYEGWGLPVSEALAFGKAVIASDAGALPEASAGCALHISPYDTRAWREAICRMAFDHQWRQQWERRVKSDFKLHDWDQAADIVLEAMDLKPIHAPSAAPPMPVLVEQEVPNLA